MSFFSTYPSSSGGSSDWFATALPNDTFLVGENSANSGTIPILKIDNGDDIQIGEVTPDTTTAHIKIGGVEVQGGNQYTGVDIKPRSHRIDIITGTTGTGGQLNLLTDALSLYSSSAFAPSLLFFEASANNAVSLKAPDSLAGSYTLTLPADDGTPNQVLATNGSGVLSWASVSSSQWTTSGSDIYYNTGNVGIGTGAGPVTKLEIEHAGDNGITLTAPYSNKIVFNNTDDPGAGERRNWQIDTEQTEAGSWQLMVGNAQDAAPTIQVFNLYKNGTCYIGPTAPSVSPSKRLSIEGDATVSGDVAAATLTPANGASGTFVSGDLVPQTIVVTNGIITSIT